MGVEEEERAEVEEGRRGVGVEELERKGWLIWGSTETENKARAILIEGVIMYGIT